MNKIVYLKSYYLRLVSLTRLAGTYIIYAAGTRFEPPSSHLSTLRVEFLATRLLDKKKSLKKININFKRKKYKIFIYRK
jgi:hypothetical protein